MSFSFEELQAELRSLHAAHYSLRQPGEWTLKEYAAANGITESTARNIMISMVAQGIVERVAQKRFIDGHQYQVFKIANKVDQPA
jgi:DNA-binding IclR family transcriptional regulator